MVKGAEGDLSVPGNMDKEVNPALRAGSEEVSEKWKLYEMVC